MLAAWLWSKGNRQQTREQIILKDKKFTGWEKCYNMLIEIVKLLKIVFVKCVKVSANEMLRIAFIYMWPIAQLRTVLKVKLYT